MKGFVFKYEDNGVDKLLKALNKENVIIEDRRC